MLLVLCFAVSSRYSPPSMARFTHSAGQATDTRSIWAGQTSKIEVIPGDKGTLVIGQFGFRMAPWTNMAWRMRATPPSCVVGTCMCPRGRKQASNYCDGRVQVEFIRAARTPRAGFMSVCPRLLSFIECLESHNCEPLVASNYLSPPA